MNLESSYFRYAAKFNSEVDRFAEDQGKQILKRLKNAVPMPIRSTVSELRAANYNLTTVRGKEYWTHPVLNALHTNAVLLLVRTVVSSSDAVNCSKSPASLQRLASFIFSSDKKQYVKDSNEDVRLALTEFQYCNEFQKNRGVESYRVMGSKTGPTQYQKENRATNIQLLQVLMYGPRNKNQKLTCPVTKAELSYTLNGVSGYDIELHHILFENRESQGKTEQPSKFMSKELRTWNHDQIVEVLKCIPLSASGHNRIHHTVSNDGINKWEERLKTKEVTHIPYMYMSQENFTEMINWLAENIPQFQKKKIGTYLSFKSSIVVDPN